MGIGFNGENYIQYLFTFFSSFVFTIFITPLLIKYLTKNGVIDEPGERRVHKVSTPRMGGLVIFSVVLLQLLSFYDDLNSIRLILLGMILITTIGILDDIHSLKWYTKFAGQILLALAVMVHIKESIMNVEIFGLMLHGCVGYIVLLFFIVGSINAVNMMDGLDGLVSGYSFSFLFVIYALAVFREDFFVIFLCLVLIGSLIAFLKYNSYPAKIFLGDTGSLLLGYFLVLTSLITSIGLDNSKTNLTFPVIILAIPILDTLKVMVTRIFRKKNPFLPDNLHLHHVIFGFHIKHKSTVFFIHLFSMFFYLLALFYIFNESKTAVLIIFGLLSILMLSVSYLLAFFEKFSVITYFYHRYLIYPYRIISHYRTVFIVTSFIALTIAIYTIFPRDLSLDHNILILFALTETILFIVAFFQVKENILQNHFYVFVNMTIFFILFQLGNEIRDVSLIPGDGGLIFRITFAFVTLFVVAVLLVRIRVFSRVNIFFSGMDLVIISFIFLSFILENFISNSYLQILRPSMIMAFIVYLWYRIIIELQAKAKKILFYSTFIISLVAIFSSF